MHVPESLSLAFTHPLLRRGLRVLLLGLTLAYFAFAVLVLVLRYAVLPQVDNYRPDIERLLGESLNRPVSIRQVDAYWVGLHPALTLKGVEIHDQQGRSALGLEQVEAELHWDSLLFMQLRLARLEIVAPELVLRRDAEGRFFVAGLEMASQSAGGDDVSDWLLAQHRLIVRDAKVRWIDEKRGAPPLELQHLNIQLDNRFSRHRIGLTAEPPPELAAKIDIRGDFKGRDLDLLDVWKGEAYAELAYADLAVWRQWVDYPVDLPQGKGGIRLWLGFARQQLSSITADVKLSDVRLRLRPDLPELDLSRLDGRLAGQRFEGGLAFQARRLALSTRDGVDIAPTDIEIKWQEASAKRPAQGNATANGLDLAALSRLAGHLPLAAGLRERLAKHHPGGTVHDLALDWRGTPEALSSWTVKGRFENLQLTALGPVPGLSGIGGRIEGSEQGGRIELKGQQASIDLPAVFPEPRLELEHLTADLAWRPASGGYEINLQKASFDNRDAAGEATARWHPATGHADGPGVIDLTARLTRASGDAVWRYIPLAVGADTRNWLRAGIHGGSSRDVSLRLAGDLAQFPFVDGKGGIFQVKAGFRDARLTYAESWPALEDIDGDLLFEGSRMLITAKRARILGVTVTGARAEIKDLLHGEELLDVSGTANGPTADFLRFIEESPVGGRIDHFTAPMQAEGRGEIEIKLALPLRRLDNSRVEGRYRFDNNRLTVDADLPPLADVRGQLNFTADTLDSKGLRASLLGSPLAIDIRTGKDGALQVNTSGELVAANLRREFASPLLDHLAGATKWTGAMRIRKQTTEVSLNTNLVGIASSLPPPFNKPATEAMNLRFERKPPPGAAPASTAAKPKVGAGETAAAGDMLEIGLGNALRLQLVRRHDTQPATLVRGSLALGGVTANLPERGLQVVGKLPSVDADFWRRAFAENGNGATQHPHVISALSPILFDLRTDELRLFDKNFRDIRVSGQRQGALTRFDLKSPGLAGNFAWDTSGSGRITGKIGQLDIPETISQPENLQAEVGNIIEELPALDIDIGKLSFKGREMGAVNIAAENRDGFWNARFKLDGDETQLKGTLKWRPDPARNETRLDFALDTKSIEKMLSRLGYNEGIRRGSAELSGQLAWHGAPVSIDYPTLTGHIEADAASGQFTKLEPGVGRLLGVLSLQSLPRRITLDFRDIFSEGFAFNRIRGKFQVEHGVMQTSDLQIQGPSAKVLMNGSIDLANETQNLKVRVQPALGETIAVGAMLTNPVAGAVAWVAQKLLKDPLDQVFAFEYAVTGHWQDPKVEKLGTAKPPATEENK